MPRIKRWFHVSHEINSDEEVWELTDLYGVWGLRVWLQFLSIADRNDGVVKGDLELLSKSMSRLWGSNSRRYSTGWRANKARMMIEWMSNKGWISIQSDSIIICNWLIYNPRKERKDFSPNLPNLPNLHKTKIKIPLKRKTTTTYPDDFEITEALKEWCEKEGVTNPQPYLEAFRDHHTAKGSRFVDWVAAFRNWIRNRNRFGPPRLIQSNEELSERTQRILRRGLSE